MSVAASMCVLLVHNLEHWEVCSVKWLCPVEVPDPPDGMHLIRCKAAPQWERLDRVVAKSAFWNCKLEMLNAFA